MEAMIDTLLTEKLDEIFLEMQERFNIKYGDVEPLDAIELAEKQMELSMVVGRILRKQRGERVIK